MQKQLKKREGKRPDMKRYQSAAGRRPYDEEGETGLSDPLFTDSHEYDDLPSHNEKRDPSEKVSDRYQSTDDSVGSKQRKDDGMRGQDSSSQNCRKDSQMQDKTETNQVKSSVENARENQEPAGDSKPTKKVRKPDREFYQPGNRRNIQGKDAGIGREQDKPPPKNHEQKSLPESSAGESEEKKKTPVHTHRGKEKDLKCKQNEKQSTSSNINRNREVEKPPLRPTASVEKITDKVEKLSMKEESNMSFGVSSCHKGELTEGAKNKEKEKPEKKRERGNRKRRGGEKEKDKNHDSRRDDEVGGGEKSDRQKVEKEKNKRTTEANRDSKPGRTGDTHQNKGRDNHKESGRGDNNNSRCTDAEKGAKTQRNVNTVVERGDRKKANANITTPTTKRYSKSDIRRSRNRTYSSSSASSVASLDGARLGMDIVNTKWSHLDSRHKNKEEMANSEKGSRSHLQSWTTNGDSSMESLEGSEYSDTGYDRRRRVEKQPSADRQREDRNRSKGNKGGGRGILHISLEKQSGTSSHSGRAQHGTQGSLPRGRGGGILVLPSRTDISNSPEVGQRLLFSNRGGTASRSRGGRGGGMRRLWDPNNPDQKPALTSAQSSQHSSLQQPTYLQTGTGYGQLHFLDTDDEIAGSPPVQQGEHFLSKQAAAMAYYKFQNSDNPYCYPMPTGSPHTPGTAAGQRYPYAYPIGPYQMSPTNGIYTGPGMGQFCGSYRGAAYSQSGAGGALTPEEVEQQARGELGRLLRAADTQELQLSNLLSRDRVSAEGLDRMSHLR